MAYDIAEDGGIRLNLERLGPLHWLRIVLAAITGAVHLYLFATVDWLPFVLAGVGFFVAIGPLLLNANRLYLYPLGASTRPHRSSGTCCCRSVPCGSASSTGSFRRR